MVNYSRHILSNGLRVIIHQDNSTPMVALNILYQVGSKDEDPDKTGFAHLFEHLMFSGTENVTNYDDIIQNAGGENNAFTNNDVTNFYSIVPAENFETLLWLEADRMKGPVFSQRSIDVQKKVVIEEFKETCLNEPYGDTWHHLSELAYQIHSYRWPTIGKSIEHIETATKRDVLSFFENFYKPNNAILSIAGNIDPALGLELVEKWFGDLKPSRVNRTTIEVDDELRKMKHKEVIANVPLSSVDLGFAMPERLNKDYYAVDLLSDILGSGRSSRLYKELVVDQEVLSYTDAFISGTKDPGLLIIEGKPAEGVTVEEAINQVWNVIETLKHEPVGERELQKIKNNAESNLVFSETSILNKAISLGYYEYLDDIELINTEVKYYQAVTPEDIHRVANEILVKERALQLIYRPKTEQI